MRDIHKPCLASAAVTSSARVASWGDSSRLMLPEEETLLSRRGEATLDLPGDCVMISAPWSTRALACSLKFNFWLSICLRQASVLVNTNILNCPLAFLCVPELMFMSLLFISAIPTSGVSRSLIWDPFWWRAFQKDFLKRQDRLTVLCLTLTLPPPGTWWALSREPTLAWAFSLKSSFTLSIFTRPPPTEEMRKAFKCLGNVKSSILVTSYPKWL